MARKRAAALARDRSRRMMIDGAALAAFARDNAHPTPEPNSPVSGSVRTRFVGLVTNIIADTVMTRVEVQCGHIAWCR